MANLCWSELKALVASKRFPIEFISSVANKLVPFRPPPHSRGKFLPENCKWHTYKKKKTSEFQNLSHWKIEKNGTVLPPNTRFLGPGIFRVLEIRELEVRFSQLLIHEFSVYWK